LWGVGFGVGFGVFLGVSFGDVIVRIISVGAVTKNIYCDYPHHYYYPNTDYNPQNGEESHTPSSSAAVQHNYMTIIYVLNCHGWMIILQLVKNVYE
jgi:hypothetical protein